MFKLIKIYFLKRLRIQQKYSLGFVIGVLAVIIIFAVYFFSDASIGLSRKILINQKKAAEKILNDLLNRLILIYKKTIYYKGYDVTKKVIQYGDILPYNILYEIQNKNDTFKIQNLLFF